MDIKIWAGGYLLVVLAMIVFIVSVIFKYKADIKNGKYTPDGRKRRIISK